MEEVRGSQVAPELLEGVAFVGDLLGPLYLNDPQDGDARGIYEALGVLDPAAAALEWPFGDADGVRQALGNMAAGAQDGVTDELTWEYRRLFVGPQKKAAPPWGSVYTDHDRVAFGASERELRRWMREVGIALQASETDPADHIGLVLAMMSWIARNKPSVLVEFLRLHVLTWAPHFAQELESATHHAFFVGLAQLTSQSLEGIRLAFGIEVDYPRFYR